MARLRWLLADADASTSWSRASSSAREVAEPVEEDPPARVEGAAGDQPGGRDGARVDHGVGPAIGAALDRGERVERQAGRVDTDPRPRLRGPDRATHQREDERLGHAHDRERRGALARCDRHTRDARDGEPEPLGRGEGEARVHLGHVALVDPTEAPVRLVDQLLHVLGRGQRAGRDERGPVRVAVNGVRGHDRSSRSSGSGTNSTAMVSARWKRWLPA